MKIFETINEIKQSKSLAEIINDAINQHKENFIMQTNNFYLV